MKKGTHPNFYRSHDFAYKIITHIKINSIFELVITFYQISIITF